MRRASSILLVVFLVCSCSTAGESPVVVTYIANAGFLIEVGESRILVDALFEDPTIGYAHVPSGETLPKMAQSLPPFNDIDLVLVTHSHRDHFEPALTADFLRSSPETILVAPPQAVAMLPEPEALGDRIRSVLPELHGFEPLVHGGIRIRAYLLEHSAYMETDPATGEQRNRHDGVQNLVYLVEVGGRKFLHTGDAVFAQSLELFEDDRFEKVDLDLVFLEYFDSSEETAEVLETWMTPDHVVFMHLPPDRDKIEKLDRHLKQGFPRAVLFAEPMEVREF